jgi:membrane associated rhomboid family serine protease
VDPVVQTTCYRHPDRVAGVTCQRCDRPICPQCMVQASVGFQCPECTHRNPERVISSRSMWAGANDPVVTKVLIGLNVAAFLLMAALGGSATSPQGGVYENGVIWGPLVADGEWWRVVTGGFLHAGVLHLGMNMFLLWLLGKELEPALGRARFALVYAVSLLGGALGVLVVSPNSPTLGASGAIFGLMGALVVLQLRARQNPWNTGIGGLIVINVVITFLIPGISIGGHLGGLIAGAAAGAVVQPLRWPQTTAGIRNGFLALMAIGFGVAAVVAASTFAADLSQFS